MRGRYDNSGKKNGEFTLYYDDGQVESTGEFKDDKRFGLWKYYFPNGKIWREVTFSAEDFFVNALYDETGKTQIKDGTGRWLYKYVDPIISKIILVEGSFTEGKKEGKWRCTSGNGDIIYEETFYKGKFKKGILLQDGRKMEYPSESQNKFLQPDKKFEMTEKFRFSDFVKRYDYPFFDFLPLSKTRLVTSEENEVFSVVEEPPTFKSGLSGFYQLIGQNIRYPSEARKMGIKGKVFVEFVINIDGSLSDIKVIKGIGGGCDEEAKRVVSLSPPWNPGKIDGKPVKVVHVIPISFN